MLDVLFHGPAYNSFDKLGSFGYLSISFSCCFSCWVVPGLLETCWN